MRKPQPEEIFNFPVFKQEYYRNTSDVTPEQLEILHYGALNDRFGRRANNLYSYCVLYPGFEHMVKKIVDERNKIFNSIEVVPIDDNNNRFVPEQRGENIRRKIASRPMLIVPPSKYITEQHIYDFNTYMFSIEFNKNSENDYNPDLSKNKKLPPALIDFLNALAGTPSNRTLKYDSRMFYRLFAFSYFIREIDKNSKMTLGEYIKANHNKILQATEEMNYTIIPEELQGFVGAYIQERMMLSFFDKSLKKNEELIHSLTVSQLLTATKEVSVFSLSNYSRVLEAYFTDLQESDNSYTLDEMGLKLFDIMIKKINVRDAKNGYSSPIENTFVNKAEQILNFVRNFSEAGKGLNLSNKTKIVKYIEEHQDELSFMNILMMVNIAETRSVFRSSDDDKVLKILGYALDHYDDPKYFIKLITKLFFSQSGHIASYSEWMEYIKNSEKDDKFDLPASLLISLMVSREKTKSLKTTHNSNEERRNTYLRYAVQEDYEDVAD